MLGKKAKDVAEMVGIEMYSDIQKLKRLGYKKNRASIKLGIDAKTIRKYWDMSQDEYLAYLLECKERSKIMDSYKDFVLRKLKEFPEITSAIIDDRLREEYKDFSPSYRTVRLYVKTLREKEGLPSTVKIRQMQEVPELPLGQQAQVDMGEKKMQDDWGRKLKVYIFAMVLSTSRYKYVCFQTEPFTAQTFVEAHDRAFRFFGGRPKEIVYDQDSIMVVRENSGDIIYTDVFENYRKYAGFSIYLCRGADPESKGKIEAVVKFVKGNFLSCRVFHGVARLNSDGLAWLERTANGRPHETTKMVPARVFEEEQRHLLPVPELSEKPWTAQTAIVRKTNVVLYRQNRYCMPRGTYRPGRKVRIEPDEKAGIIRFYDAQNNAFLEEHALCADVGKCIRNRHADRDRNTKIDALQDKAMLGFENSHKAHILIQGIRLEKPRYVRDQLSLIVKLQSQYEPSELAFAVDYCLKRRLFSAVDFKDTLEYFKTAEPVPLIKPVEIPIKYKIYTAQERPIRTYTEIFMGGEQA